MKASMNRRQFLSMGAVALADLGLAGCGGSSDSGAKSDDSSKGDAAKGSVYYLNFKPEVDEE